MAQSSKIDFNNPPEVKIYIPVPTNEEDIRISGIDRKYIIWHKFSATNLFCKMFLVDKEATSIAKFYIADIKNTTSRPNANVDVKPKV